MGLWAGQEPSKQTASSSVQELIWIVSSGQGGFIRAYNFFFLLFLYSFFFHDLGLSFIWRLPKWGNVGELKSSSR